MNNDEGIFSLFNTTSEHTPVNTSTVGPYYSSDHVISKKLCTLKIFGFTVSVRSTIARAPPRTRLEGGKMSANYATPPPQGHEEGTQGGSGPQGLLQGSIHVATVGGIPIR
jgi:hypothetical protein